MSNMDQSRLANEMSKRMNQRGIGLCDGPTMLAVVAVMKDRAQTLEEMADKIGYLYTEFDEYNPDSVSKHVTAQTAGLLSDFLPVLSELENWEKSEISQAIKDFVSDKGIKFPHIAQPLRIAVSGSDNTPSIDIVLQLIGKHRSLARIEKAIDFFSR